MGWLTQTTLPDPDGDGGLSAPVIVYAYDEVGNRTSTTDARGKVTAQDFDNLNRLVLLTLADPDGAGGLSSPAIAYAYDAASQNTTVTDALGKVTTKAYDGLGRVTSVTQPDPDGAGGLAAPVTSFSHDAVGNVVSMTDPLSHTTNYDYDKLYRLVTTTLPDPDGAGGLSRPVTTLAYDKVGNRTSLTDPVGNETAWTFDVWNRVTAETNENSDVRSFEYDTVSNLTKITDRLGRVREFTFDNLDRQTQEVWKISTTVYNTIDTVYDAAGQVTDAEDDFSDYAYAYNGLGQVTQSIADIGGPLVKLKQEYDPNGNRTALKSEINFGAGYVKDLQNEYTYDYINRTTRIDQKDQSGGSSIADKRVDFSYLATGQFDVIARYDDLAGGSGNEIATSDYGYDFIGRLTSLTHTHSTTTIADYDWTFDAASRITQQVFASSTGLDGTTNFSYDHTNQVTAADHDYMTDETFSFDTNGNRTGGGYSTGANNYLTSDGVWNYTTDDEGNRISQQRISSASVSDYRIEYTWDHRNRLAKIVTKNNGGTVTHEVDYKYDLYDRRIEKAVDADGAGGGGDVITRFAYDGIHELFEFNGSDDLKRRNLYANATDMIMMSEDVAALNVDGDILAALTDHLLSVRDLVDDTGAVVNHITYATFGAIASETSSTNFPFAYTGRDRDNESLLQYNRARYYDAYAGRWISEDPIGFAAGDFHLARYVSNSAMVGRDPTGQSFWTDYLYYLHNPDQMDRELEIGFYVAGTVGITAAAAASGGTVLAGGAGTFGGGVIVGAGAGGVIGAGTAAAAGENPVTGGVIGVVTGAAGGAAGGVVTGSTTGIVIAAGAAGGATEGAIDAVLNGDDVLTTAVISGVAGAATGGVLDGAARRVFRRGGPRTGWLDDGGLPIVEINCFVAGTPVVVGVEGLDNLVATAATEPPFDQTTVVLLGLGLGGWVLSRARRSPSSSYFVTQAGSRSRSSARSRISPSQRIQSVACPQSVSPDSVDPAKLSATDHFWQDYEATAKGSPANRGDTRSAAAPSGARGRAIVGTFWLAACLLLACFSVRSQRGTTQATSAPAAVETIFARPIETIRVGQRVIANDTSGKVQSPTAVIPSQYRLVALDTELHWDDGTRDEIHIESLMPQAKLESDGVVIGSVIPVPLDVVEMGMPKSLTGRVTRIEACPAISEGPGCAVLTTIDHLNCYLFDLRVEDSHGKSSQITVTGYHKIWSRDRNDWVSACELRQGEQLSGVDKPVTVSSLSRRPGTERVYNFSVEGDHTYRVSQLGILVHNPDCVGPVPHSPNHFDPNGPPNTSTHGWSDKTGMPTQTRIFDENGESIMDIDWRKHGKAGPGHYHEYPPGQPDLGHGKGAPHPPLPPDSTGVMVIGPPNWPQGY